MVSLLVPFSPNKRVPDDIQGDTALLRIIKDHFDLEALSKLARIVRQSA